MKKVLLILVLSVLVISFSVFVQRGQSLVVGGPAIHQEDYWKAEYDKLKAEYDKLVNVIVPQVEALASSLDEMRSELEDLRSELETSKADYSALNVKYTSSVRDLNTRTTLMYAFIVTTVVFLATTLYLAFRRKT